MSEVDEQALIRRYRTARRDPHLAVLEGFHALKHALRFGAEVLEAVAADPVQLRELAAELAPDLGDALAERTAPVSTETIAELVQAAVDRAEATSDLNAVIHPRWRPAPASSRSPAGRRTI